MKGLKKKFQLGKPEELTDKVVMDVGATLAFATCMTGKSPCLTKTPAFDIKCFYHCIVFAFLYFC